VLASCDQNEFVAVGGRPAAEGLELAVNRLVTEMTTRAPLLLLPIVFTLAQIGIFDAADRIRLTLGIMVAVATTAIMPALSRMSSSRVISVAARSA